MATSTQPRDGQAAVGGSATTAPPSNAGDGPLPGARRQWYRRGWLVGIAALLIGIGIGAATSSSKPKTLTATVTSPAQTITNTITRPGKTRTKIKTVVHVRTVTGPAATVTQTASAAAAPSSGSAGSYTGTDTQNLGTINVAADSTLHWTCPGCASSNFIIENDFNDANTIDVNSLNQTSGRTVVSAGKYTKVDVLGSGNWSLTITPGT